jgi:hypothetical protein
MRRRRRRGRRRRRLTGDVTYTDFHYYGRVGRYTSPVHN